MEKNAQCCFCGKSEKQKNLIPIILIINKKNEQQIFLCHKKCIAQRLYKDMILHPELQDSLDSE